MSLLYILDENGRILINFDYRGEGDIDIADKFMIYLQTTQILLPNPVFRVDDLWFVYIQRSNMFFITVTKSNSNVALLLTFLDHFSAL
jgi:AP-1 complex subunit mu